MKKERFSFKGWNFPIFLKGRKRLLVTIIGAVAAFIITNEPKASWVVGGVSECLFALIDYFIKQED